MEAPCEDQNLAFSKGLDVSMLCHELQPSSDCLLLLLGKNTCSHALFLTSLKVNKWPCLVTVIENNGEAVEDIPLKTRVTVFMF